MRRLIRLMALAIAFLLPALSAQAGSTLQPTCTISLAQWEAPNRNQALLSDPALRTLVQGWEAQPGSRLRIEYPPGEQGELWANRLRAWLVAFGIPGSAIQVLPGGNESNALALSLRSGAGGGA